MTSKSKMSRSSLLSKGLMALATFGLLQEAAAGQLDPPPAMSGLVTETPADAIFWTESNHLGGFSVVDQLYDIRCGGNVEGHIQVSVLKNDQGYRHYYWRITDFTGSGYVSVIEMSNLGSITVFGYHRTDGLGAVAPQKLTQDDHGHFNWRFADGALTSAPGNNSSKFMLMTTTMQDTLAVPRTARYTSDHTLIVDVRRPGAPGTPVLCDAMVAGSTTQYGTVYVPR